MILCKGCEITPPITPCPSNTLFQVLWIRFEGGLNLALLVALDVNLPFVLHKPPRDEVVIVTIETVFAPAERFVDEFGKETLVT